ncbi:MAG: imidazole glycerol phosphate synthase subunit HisH [Gammaproteobacteria bacterium]|nr:imidazole glycerol phosphate synthase subunit HisH [Gammaproteobacteria bacterium]
MSRVALIDHGLGNLQAVEKALSKVSPSGPVFRCYDPTELKRADCLVLSGTGQLDACVAELQRLGMAEILADYLQEKPILAINLGLLAMCSTGLDLVPGDAVPMNADGSLDVRLPHIGWNTLERQQDHPLFEGISEEAPFYFAHGVRLESDAVQTVATATHGERFPAMVAHGNFIGVQFHPEISDKQGLRFLANFINWDNQD